MSSLHIQVYLVDKLPILLAPHGCRVLVFAARYRRLLLEVLDDRLEDPHFLRGDALRRHLNLALVVGELLLNCFLLLSQPLITVAADVY